VALRRLLSRKGAVVAAAGILAGLLAAVFPAPAHASELIARNTSTERLQVSADGRALVSFHARGGPKRVLAWGAINARPPSRARRQVQFEVDYSGGWGRFGKPVWKTLRDACGPYRGPALSWLVTACTMPDGSHWALQKWQRSQANLGMPPFKPGHGAQELRLSHWSGDVAQVEAWVDWSYSGRWHHIFGRVTYRGEAVHGFTATTVGEPTDSYGRVVNLDTLDSAYGPGWRRENAFLARRPDGTFCYGFVPHGRRPAANGKRYRLATSGPGVTPDVTWEGPGLHDFRGGNPEDLALESEMNLLQRRMMRESKGCHD
jgi:hypothetical protein